MGEYQENKPIKRSIKLKQNNHGEIVAIQDEKKKKKNSKKKPKKAQKVQTEAETPKRPHERKKLLEQKMAKKNSKAILRKTFDIDLEEYLDKSLLFDLEKDKWGNKFLIQSLKKYWAMTSITLNREKVPMLLE